MNLETAALTLALIDTACWIVCFWWMHRLSGRQETMLLELHDMTKRIEGLSRAEHDLIQEVHPKVDDLKEKVEDVAVAVSESSNAKRSPER